MSRLHQQLCCSLSLSLTTLEAAVATAAMKILAAAVAATKHQLRALLLPQLLLVLLILMVALPEASAMLQRQVRQVCWRQCCGINSPCVCWHLYFCWHAAAMQWYVRHQTPQSLLLDTAVEHKGSKKACLSAVV